MQGTEKAAGTCLPSDPQGGGSSWMFLYPSPLSSLQRRHLLAFLRPPVSVGVLISMLQISHCAEGYYVGETLFLDLSLKMFRKIRP